MYKSHLPFQILLGSLVRGHLQRAKVFSDTYFNRLNSWTRTHFCTLFEISFLAAEIKRQEKQHIAGPPSHNIFGGSEEVIGQRARNRKPPGGESHNIFG